MNILTIHEIASKPSRLVFSDESVKGAWFETAYLPGPWDLIVRWGCVDGYDNDRVPVLNPASALRNLQDLNYIVETLRAHGIRTGYLKDVLGRVPRIARYRLHVFDMRVLSTLRWHNKKLIRAYGTTRRMRKIREMAIRVVYSLGLHFAAVDVGVIGKHDAVPIAINPAPLLNTRLGKLYADAAVAYAKRWYERRQNTPKTVVLGADLEFIMKRRTGRIIYASRYFPYRGPIGYDEQGSRSHRRLHPIAEIRPSPSSDPEVLVDRIKQLLRTAARKTPRRGVSWQAGSAPVSAYPIGGHIHFSHMGMSTELVRALDNYLALPLMMLENPEKARLRRPKYGYLGEIRWGYHGGFEYRVPSSWIVAPDYALAVLTLAKLIACNYERLNRNIFLDPHICRMFYASDKEGMRQYFDDAWNDLRSLSDYKVVAERLEIFPTVVRENRRWMESRDLRVRWGLVAPIKRKRRSGR